MNRCCSANMPKLTGALLGGACAAALVAAALSLAVVFFLPDKGKLSAKCDDKNPCTDDVQYLNKRCDHFDLSTDAACSDACYTSGHCNGHGGCQGTAATCKGSCDSIASSTCDNLFKWNPDAILAFTWGPDTYGTSCFADRCTAYFTYSALDDQVYRSTDANFPVPGLQCQDFLDAAYWAANSSCIVTHVSDAQYVYLNNYFSGNPGDNGFFASLRVCEYAWKCSVWNHTAFEWWWDD